MAQHIPNHVAIVMDGNGRWAEKRILPKIAGHRAGVKVLKAIIEHSVKYGVKILTVFAFSSENWNRPIQEVQDLMELFIEALKNEAHSLQENKIKIKFIGDCSKFSAKLRQHIASVAAQAVDHEKLTLVIAVNYGGRWDVVQACKTIACKVETGKITSDQIDIELFNRHTSTFDLPDPDLFIRTSNEYRVSNFLLWQLAYTELFFCEELWPDFTIAIYQKALDAYAIRERRFGR